jgi:NTP pyrophosphatase (non-canonical NTP hydrolase)
MDEIEKVMALMARRGDADVTDALIRRAEELAKGLEEAQEDLFKSVIQSHKVLCHFKDMEEDAAYGQDPAMYYTMGVCGEAGEMANKIVKALRNGNDPEAARRAVVSELPDVFIYGAVLAHVLGIDLTRLVNEKVQVVMDRARSGYYGGPLDNSK